MSASERWGTRDLTYSNWHRTPSIGRFVGPEVANTLTMIDLDGLEYCHRCREVVGVIEVARDVGQSFKPSVVTRKLAQRLGVPGLLVFYMPSETEVVGSYADIQGFRARVIAPTQGFERHLVPAEFARWIKELHGRCECLQEQAPAISLAS